MEQITQEQWSSLDNEHKMYALLRLGKQSFLPLLTDQDLRFLTGSKSKSIKTLLKKYKKQTIYTKDGNKFKLYKPKNV